MSQLRKYRASPLPRRYFSAPAKSVRLGGLGPDVEDELGRGRAFFWRHVNLLCQISRKGYYSERSRSVPVAFPDQ